MSMSDRGPGVQGQGAEMAGHKLLDKVAQWRQGGEQGPEGVSINGNDVGRGAAPHGRGAGVVGHQRNLAEALPRPEGQRQEEVRTFRTMTRDILAMRAWLQAQ